MSHQVVWTKIVLERFIEIGCLTKEEEAVMRTRAAGWTRVEQSMKLGMSLSAIDRITKRLKIKYDYVQEQDKLLPERKRTAKEIYGKTK